MAVGVLPLLQDQGRVQVLKRRDRQHGEQRLKLRALRVGRREPCKGGRKRLVHLPDPRRRDCIGKGGKEGKGGGSNDEPRDPL